MSAPARRVARAPKASYSTPPATPKYVPTSLAVPSRSTADCEGYTVRRSSLYTPNEYAKPLHDCTSVAAANTAHAFGRHASSRRRGRTPRSTSSDDSTSRETSSAESVSRDAARDTTPFDPIPRYATRVRAGRLAVVARGWPRTHDPRKTPTKRRANPEKETWKMLTWRASRAATTNRARKPRSKSPYDSRAKRTPTRVARSLL